MGALPPYKIISVLLCISDLHVQLLVALFQLPISLLAESSAAACVYAVRIIIDAPILKIIFLRLCVVSLWYLDTNTNRARALLCCVTITQLSCLSTRGISFVPCRVIVLLSEVDHVGRGIIGYVLLSEVDHVGRGS